MQRVNEIRQKLGQRAFKRVLSEMPPHITASREMAREVKRKRSTLKATAEWIYELAKLLRESRRRPGWARRRGMVHRPSCSCKWYLGEIAVREGRRGRRPVLLPRGTLQDRLFARYRRGVRYALRGNVRSYARQSDTRVEVVSTFNRTGIVLHKDEGWIEYSDRNRYGVVDAWYQVRVLKGWLSLPDWIKECDGMLTVAAIRVEEEQPGETIYRARWAVQVRGDVETREGYIIRYERDGNEYTAHGRSVSAARGSITKQLPEWVAAETERQRKRAERIERMKGKVLKSLEAGKLNGYEVPVTLRDSNRAGNCPDGSQHWAEMHFPDRDSAMVSEILDVSDQRERALLACVAAIRRQRPETFAG